MTDTTLNGLDELEAAWTIIANAYGGNWASAPDDWRGAAERWRDEVWHPALDASQVSPDPPLRFDNATTVREIAYRCAGAGSGAVMRLAGDVVMPATEIGEAVEEILCDFWPEAMAADSDSPDERLREALDNLLAAVTDVERRGEAGLIEALDDAMNDAADLLAAADREKPETDT